MKDTTPFIDWSNIVVHLIWATVAITLFVLHLISPTVLIVLPEKTPTMEDWTQETPNLGSLAGGESEA